MSISRWLLLGLATAGLLTGCSGLNVNGMNDDSAFRSIYRSAFSQFAARNVTETEINHRPALALKPDYRYDLTTMTRTMDRNARFKGIDSHTKPAKNEDYALRAMMLTRALSDQFNPKTPNGDKAARRFVETLLNQGAAVQDTGFCRGEPRRDYYERAYIIGTLVNAKCGILSCFNQDAHAVQTKIVHVKVPYLSKSPSLRMAETAAMSGNAVKARRLLEMGRHQDGYEQVRDLVKRMSH